MIVKYPLDFGDYIRIRVGVVVGVAAALVEVRSLLFTGFVVCL